MLAPVEAEELDPARDGHRAHRAQAAETPNILPPTTSSSGTIRPMSGPATPGPGARNSITVRCYTRRCCRGEAEYAQEDGSLERRAMNTKTRGRSRSPSRGSAGPSATRPRSGSWARTSEILPRATSTPCSRPWWAGEADRGLLPIENSLAGSIHENYDRLEASTLHIVGEAQLRIRQCLIARPGASLASIRRVASHPVALAQCRRFFAERPQIEPIPAYDTAGSVQDLLRDGAATNAAIASALAARLYGGQILLEGIEDDPQNFTRFLVLAREPGPVAEATKTSVVFTLKNAPGALHRAARGVRDPRRGPLEDRVASAARPALGVRLLPRRPRLSGGRGGGGPRRAGAAWPSTSASWAPTPKDLARPGGIAGKLHTRAPGCDHPFPPPGGVPGVEDALPDPGRRRRRARRTDAGGRPDPPRPRACPRGIGRAGPRAARREPPSTSSCSTSGCPASAGSRPAPASASATAPRCPSSCSPAIRTRSWCAQGTRRAPTISSRSRWRSRTWS